VGVAWEDITEERAKAFRNEKQEEKKGERVGSWCNQPIYKKTGKFGEYLQCGDLSIPYQIEEEAATIARFEAKTQTGPLKQFKEYVIRTGQYGPYIMKTSLKKAQFVSLPNGVNPATLTEKEVEAIYKLGMESKKKWKKK
jgi:topoisomerase IA-like protein